MTARPIMITSCLLTLLLPLSAKADGWEKLPSLPEPNGGFVSGVDHGHVVVAGGTNWENGIKKWLSTFHLFDPSKKRWITRMSLDKPLAYAVAGNSKKGIMLGDALVFAGGTTGTSGSTQLGLLEGHSHLILRKGLPADQAVVLAAGGMIGENLLFVGGTDDPGNVAGFKRTAFSMDTQGQTTPLPDYPGKPFGTAASTTLGDSLYIFAGANWNADTQTVVNTDEAYAFSMKAQAWKKLATFPYPVRGLSAVPLNDGTLYLAGGYKSDAEGFTDEAFLYNIPKDEYRPAKALPYKAMVGLVVFDGYVYCLGGEDKQKSRTDACFRIPITELLNK